MHTNDELAVFRSRCEGEIFTVEHDYTPKLHMGPKVHSEGASTTSRVPTPQLSR